MMLRKSDIEIVAKSRQGHGDERDRCLELMKEYNLAGMHDPERWKTIVRQSEFASAGWTEAHGKWQRLMLQQETERLTLAREFVGRMVSLSRVQVPALAAIRSELESDAARELILEEAERTAAVMVGAMNELIPMIEAGLENIRREIEADEQGQNGDARVED
jgi:hypothetical protein